LNVAPVLRQHGCYKCRDPDHVAKTMAELSQAGLTGMGISLINYLDELPFFCDEVLPRLERMGVRERRPSQALSA
jgi:hypothetical protein